MTISLSSPKYAKPESLAYQMYKKQKDRKKRKSLLGDGLGQELVVNGGFDTDSDWTLSGAVISGGVVTISGTSNGFISQNINVTNGSLVRVEYTVTSTSVAGLLFLSSSGFGGVTESLDKSVGTHEMSLTVMNDTNPLKILHNTTDAISLDNVSVKEVLNVA